MGHTFAEKVLARNAGLSSVRVGQVIDVFQAHGSEQVGDELQHRQARPQRDAAPGEIRADREEIRRVQLPMAVNGDRKALIDLGDLIFQAHLPDHVEQESIRGGDELRARIDQKPLPFDGDHPPADVVTGLQYQNVLAGFLELIGCSQPRDPCAHDDACVCHDHLLLPLRWGSAPQRHDPRVAADYRQASRILKMGSEASLHCHARFDRTGRSRYSAPGKIGSADRPLPTWSGFFCAPLQSERMKTNIP